MPRHQYTKYIHRSAETQCWDSRKYKVKGRLAREALYRKYPHDFLNGFVMPLNGVMNTIKYNLPDVSSSKSIKHRKNDLVILANIGIELEEGITLPPKTKAWCQDNTTKENAIARRKRRDRIRWTRSLTDVSLVIVSLNKSAHPLAPLI